MDRYGHLFPSEDAAIAQRLEERWQRSQTDNRRTNAPSSPISVAYWESQGDLAEVMGRLDAYAAHLSTHPCQVAVPGRHSGSGSYTTLSRGLGSGVDPVGSPARVGERTVGPVRVVAGRMGAQHPAVG